MRQLTLCLCLALSLSACGDDDSSPITFASLPAAWESTFCEYAVACDRAPDLATCREILDETALFAEIAPYVNNGTISYDAAAAGECLAAVPTTCRLDSEIEAPACDEMFSGTLATDAACIEDEQCQSGYCDKSCTEACCAGVCAAEDIGTEVPLGGDCSPDGTYCAEGSFEKYNDTFTTCTCTAPLAAGAACSLLDDCAGNNYCVGATFTTDSTCGPLANQGQACNPESYYGCALSTDYCDSTTLVCTAKVAVGATCSVDEDNCVRFAECVDGTCVVLPMLGDACTADGLSCYGDTECLNNATPAVECADTDTGCTCRFPTVETCPAT